MIDLILPSAMWMEKEGAFGNAERRTQVWRQQVSAPGQAKSDLWQLLNADVSLANMKALITGQPAPSAQPQDEAEAQAQEIMAHASREAQRRGKKVADILPRTDGGSNAPASEAVVEASEA